MSQNKGINIQRLTIKGKRYWVCPYCNCRVPVNRIKCSCGYEFDYHDPALSAWECIACGCKNADTSSICHVCGASCPLFFPAKWQCSQCSSLNVFSSSVCIHCGYPQVQQPPSNQTKNPNPSSAPRMKLSRNSFIQLNKALRQLSGKFDTTFKTVKLDGGESMSKSDLHAQCANQVILAYKSSPLIKSQILEEAYHSALEAEQHTDRGVCGEFDNRATYLLNGVIHDIYDPETWSLLVGKCHNASQDDCSVNLSVKQQTIYNLVNQVHMELCRKAGIFSIIIGESIIPNANLEEIVKRMTASYDLT